MTESQRAAWHLLNRLEAAAAGTRQMLEDDEPGHAYENLIRMEGMLTQAKLKTQLAMTERRWALNERPRPRVD